MISFKSRLRVIYAIVRKELKISFRFPKNFIATQVMNPLRLLVSFWLVYKSFFVITNNESIGTWSRVNYVAVLLIGTIFYTSCASAFYRYRQHFINEKYWGTIQILLTAPVSKFDFLTASSLAIAAEMAIPSVLYISLLIFSYGFSLATFGVIFIVLYFMIFAVLGLGLIQGAVAIANENYLFIFDYLFAGMICFSCFYYSDSAIPAIFRPLVHINPIFHAVEIARNQIFHHLDGLEVLKKILYLAAFALFAPLAGAIVFRKVVREVGVRGF